MTSKQRANELKTVPADEKSTMQVMMIEKPLRKTGEIEEREQSEWKSKNKNSWESKNMSKRSVDVQVWGREWKEI